MKYDEFIGGKSQLIGNFGFNPVFMPDFLFDFQRELVEWSLIKGRAAIFADCGLGKTPMYLAWSQNVVLHTNGRVLILTPMSVTHQTVREGEKFGIEAYRSKDGTYPITSKIIVTNYERLHYFNKNDFVAVVCDESSILKNFDGVTRAAITEFMRQIKYRLLCTATASPNDYTELGTSSEALGDLGYMDMLSKFFKTDSGTLHTNRNWSGSNKFRFRGHAERDFWRWVCSWARAMRKPSDFGYEDKDFILPPLTTNQYVIECKTPNEEFLFDLPAIGLSEQRKERSRTITERCEKAAFLVNRTDTPAVCWCHLNSEGDLLAKLIPDAKQVSGKDDDDKKEEMFKAFQDGELRVLITKPSIAGFGLNWQHCSHQTFFPSHSFEQWYQAIRRSWRFGQHNPVTIDVITSEGESDVLKNLQRKAKAAEKMFEYLVELMSDELMIQKANKSNTLENIPSWL